MSKTAEQGTETEGSLVGGEIRALMEVTLLIKKCRKFSHTAGEALIQAVYGAFRTELMVLNNTRGM